MTAPRLASPPRGQGTGGASHRLVPRRGRVAVPSLLSGLLVAASVPPWGQWWAAFLGLGLLAWLLPRLRARGRLLAGLLFGIGLFGPTLEWVTSFNAAGYGALVLVESGFYVLAFGLVPRDRGREPQGGRRVPRWGWAPAFPAVVTLAQEARSVWPFGGFPMGGIALGQAGGPLLAAARVGGPLLVTGLAAMGGVGLAELGRAGEAWWRARQGAPGSGRGAAGGGRRRGMGAGHLLSAGLAAAIVAGAVAGGTVAPDGGPPVGRLRVGLVQGGGPRGLRAIDVNPAIIYHAQLAATHRLHPPLGLVLWPEDVISLPGPILGSPTARQVGDLARSLHATLVAGVTELVGATRFTNKAVAWNPRGRIIGWYEKVHRVPFGEYVPFRSVLKHIVNLSDVPRDAIPGHGPGLLRTPAGPLGVMISYEVFFASRARAAVLAGGQLLVVPTNTSSYASDLVPKEEVAADKLRAVEEGRELVQASPVGYSTVVTRHGAVVRRSRLGPRQVIEAEVTRRRGLTLYARGGDLPELALAGALLIVGWVLGGRRERAPG